MSTKRIKAVVVGQPNVGKSSLINAISGASLHVGNFSGVTVEKKEVHFKEGDYQVTLIDLPGLYSLNAYTPEEHVTKEYLDHHSYDLVINVIDANTLGRNLALTLQLLDRHPKMLVVVNMIDEVRSAGGSIDALALENLLGVSVVIASSKTLEGIDLFTQKIVTTFEAPQAPRKIYYDEKIEDELDLLAKV